VTQNDTSKQTKSKQK